MIALQKGDTCGAARLIATALAVTSIHLFASPWPADQETEWAVDGLVDPVKVWVPDGIEELAEGERLPTLFYYHGTGGQPTTLPPRSLAEAADWIIIGMSYQARGRYDYSPEELQQTIRLRQGITQQLNRHLPIDPARIYVGGFSKGGWVSAMQLEQDGSLAGGAILGAGSLKRAGDPAVAPFWRPKSVYVGIGESDGNLAMSLRAARDFEALGARVTFDEWLGVGHQYPSEMELLRQWCRIEYLQRRDEVDLGQDLELLAEATEWLEDSMAELNDSQSMDFERLLRLRALRTAPFFGYADGEVRGDLEDELAAMQEKPEMTEELAAEARYREILMRESQDRFVTTLILSNRGYADLAESVGDTWFGKRAAAAKERTDRTLESVPPEAIREAEKALAQ